MQSSQSRPHDRMVNLATWLVFLAEDGLGWELKVFGMADDVKAGEDALGFVL